MSKIWPDLLDSCERFTARFGFITKDIFFEHISNLNRTASYDYWNRLSASTSFVSALSDKNILYLSSRRKRTLPYKSVFSRHQLYIPHDMDVARVYLSLHSERLVLRDWLEPELTPEPWEAVAILGCDRFSKSPDLLAEVSVSGLSRLVAVEIERRRKTRGRYDEIASNYLQMRNVDLIIYGYESSKIEDEVKRAFELVSAQPLATYDLDDFRLHGLDCRTRVNGHTQSFRELLFSFSEEARCA